LALAVVVGGCKVDARVVVRMRADGSGVVSLRVVADAEAVMAVESGGSKLETAVRLDDAKAAGWTVGPWVRAKDGSASIVLSHPFARAGDLAGLVRQLNGAAGPLRGVHATRGHGLLATDYGVQGRIDLAGIQTGVAADPQLIKNLTAQAVDPNTIDKELLAQLKAAFSLGVVVRLPGKGDTVVQGRPGHVTRIDASSSVRDTQRLLFLVAAVGFAALGALMWVRGGRRRRRARSPRPAPGRGSRGPARTGRPPAR
jgi:hypothetical protein